MPFTMMDVRIYTLVHRELTGELTSAETLELAILKKQVPAMNVAQDLSLIWNVSQEYFPTNKWNASGAKANLMQRISDDRSATQTTPSNNNILKYAGAAFLVLALSFLAYYFSATNNSGTTGTPKIENIEFASFEDNTKYWIEEGSSVAMTAFSSSERKISLVGNAIFDVAKDAERPFIINMGEGVYAQVLGTSFKASSTHSDEVARISVREGTVKLFTKGAYASERILTAGQTGEINTKTRKSKKFESSAPIVLSNSDNLKLRNIPLKKAFPMLSKYFGVTFDISDAELSCVYNNTLVQSQNLEELLSAMQTSYPKITIKELPRSRYAITGSCE